MDQRMNSRVPVKFPVSCTFTDNRYRRMLSLGEVCDLGVGGIKIRVPIKPYSLRSLIVDYSMVLPQPFSEIHGSGRIVWDRWDQEKDCMTMGVAFLTLDREQQKELESIVEEVHDGTPAREASVQ